MLVWLYKILCRRSWLEVRRWNIQDEKVDRRTRGRKELRWTMIPDWWTGATILMGGENVWVESAVWTVGETRGGGLGELSRWKSSTKVGGEWGLHRRPPPCPIDPFHPAGVWRLRRWTLVCSRSWGWGTVAASSSGLSSFPLLLSPSATAPPSCPSPLQRRCCRWACGEAGQRGREVLLVKRQTQKGRLKNVAKL